MLAVLVHDSRQRISVHFILHKGTMRRVLAVKSTAVSRVITWRSQYSCSVPTPGTSDAEPEQLLQGRLSLSVFWAAETPYSSATDRDFRNGEARGLLTSRIWS